MIFFEQVMFDEQLKKHDQLIGSVSIVSYTYLAIVSAVAFLVLAYFAFTSVKTLSILS
jgi:hypothetical protein